MLYGIIVIIFVGGISAAWAATITLDGDVDVTGTLDGPTIASLQAQINQITPICPPENIQHWDKIKFFVTASNLVGIKTIISANAQQPTLTTVPHTGANPETSFSPLYDIKVIDDPTKVVDLQQVVSDFLNAHGYLLSQGGQVGRAVIPADIGIADIEYAIVCTLPPT